MRRPNLPGFGAWRPNPLRPRTLLVVLFLLAAVLARPARAQLAQSFYSVTGIQTRTLPNAVQITIRTDGSVLFGGDVEEFLNTASNFTPRQITSLRLRLVRARARLPAFVDIGAYPVDSAVISLGSDELKRPFLSNGAYQALPTDPRVDIQLRFSVPITVRRFVVDRYSGGASSREGSVGFGEETVLGPRDAAVEIGPDRRSILITVISDRVDGGRAARIRRSPPETQKHRLTVTPQAPPAAPVAAPVEQTPSPAVTPPLLPNEQRLPGLGGGPRLNETNVAAPAQTPSSPLPVSAPSPARFRVDALHSPLSGLLDDLSAATGVPLVARGQDVAEINVSLLLPDATLGDVLRALAIGYGLIVSPRDGANHGYEIARAGVTGVTERLPLRNLSPVAARLLLPDFLLPVLRADEENNALIVAGSPELIARVRSDLAVLDAPRPQVRVEAQAIEFSTTDDARFALGATQSAGGQTQSFNSAAGQISVKIAPGEQKQFSLAVDALRARGKARLLARPFVVAASGAPGTLFLGQSRYVQVLQTRGGRQVATAISLPIGYSLSVTPTIGASDDITLDLNPRLSTVDAVEAGTGLPTLGIREVNSVVRLRPGETVVLAGLDSDLSFDTRRPFGRDKSAGRTALVLLVSARKV